jgi:UPF0755 protein
VALASGVVLVGLVAWAVSFVVHYPDRSMGGVADPGAVVIARGASLSDVVAVLEKKKILHHPSLFRLYVNQKGHAHKIRHGRYTNLSGKMTPRQLIAALIRGPKVRLRTVTIPEGKNMLEVADILAEKGFGSRKELERLMRKQSFISALGVEGKTLEGYLYPDTYKFRVSAGPKDVLTHLVKRHHHIMDELKKKYPNGFVRLKHTYHFDERELVIMASIVEKETGAPAERPLVASVYLNRLRFPWFKPKRLEADPTIIYGCVVPKRKSEACLRFRGRIRRIHLRDPENPYNTYKREGLPPGPICNPGRAALAAVLRPARTKYVFFVSKNDGTHKFSETRREHERAVWIYQKRGHRKTRSARARRRQRAPSNRPRPRTRLRPRPRPRQRQR